MHRSGARKKIMVAACAVYFLQAACTGQQLRADIGYYCGGWGGWRPVTPYQRMERAGCPYCISPIAHVSNEPADCGYYVGGGAPLGGEGRWPLDGTWGWDYAPWYSRVRLRWYHGKYQGGDGQYQSDRCTNPVNHFLDRP
jgi:hypothetical protein